MYWLIFRWNPDFLVFGVVFKRTNKYMILSLKCVRLTGLLTICNHFSSLARIFPVYKSNEIPSCMYHKVIIITVFVYRMLVIYHVQWFMYITFDPYTQEEWNIEAVMHLWVIMRFKWDIFYALRICPKTELACKWPALLLYWQ